MLRVLLVSWLLLVSSFASADSKFDDNLFSKETNVDSQTAAIILRNQMTSFNMSVSLKCPYKEVNNSLARGASETFVVPDVSWQQVTVDIGITGNDSSTPHYVIVATYLKNELERIAPQDTTLNKISDAHYEGCTGIICYVFWRSDKSLLADVFEFVDISNVTVSQGVNEAKYLIHGEEYQVTWNANCDTSNSINGNVVLVSDNNAEKITIIENVNLCSKSHSFKLDYILDSRVWKLRIGQKFESKNYNGTSSYLTLISGESLKTALQLTDKKSLFPLNSLINVDVQHFKNVTMKCELIDESKNPLLTFDSVSLGNVNKVNFNVTKLWTGAGYLRCTIPEATLVMAQPLYSPDESRLIDQFYIPDLVVGQTVSITWEYNCTDSLLNKNVDIYGYIVVNEYEKVEVNLCHGRHDLIVKQDWQNVSLQLPNGPESVLTLSQVTELRFKKLLSGLKVANYLVFVNDEAKLDLSWEFSGVDSEISQFVLKNNDIQLRSPDVKLSLLRFQWTLSKDDCMILDGSWSVGFVDLDLFIKVEFRGVKKENLAFQPVPTEMLKNDALHLHWNIVTDTDISRFYPLGQVLVNGSIVIERLDLNANTTSVPMTQGRNEIKVLSLQNVVLFEHSVHVYDSPIKITSLSASPEWNQWKAGSSVVLNWRGWEFCDFYRTLPGTIFVGDKRYEVMDLRDGSATLDLSLDQFDINQVSVEIKWENIPLTEVSVPSIMPPGTFYQVRLIHFLDFHIKAESNGNKLNSANMTIFEKDDFVVSVHPWMDGIEILARNKAGEHYKIENNVRIEEVKWRLGLWRVEVYFGDFQLRTFRDLKILQRPAVENLRLVSDKVEDENDEACLIFEWTYAADQVSHLGRLLIYRINDQGEFESEPCDVQENVILKEQRYRYRPKDQGKYGFKIEPLKSSPKNAAKVTGELVAPKAPPPASIESRRDFKLIIYISVGALGLILIIIGVALWQWRRRRLLLAMQQVEPIAFKESEIYMAPISHGKFKVQKDSAAGTLRAVKEP